MGESSERRFPLPSFGIRMLAAVILVPLCVFIFLRGGWLFALATGALSVALLAEYGSLAAARGCPHLFAKLVAPALLIIAACWQLGAAGGLAAFVVILLGTLGFAAVRGRIAGAAGRVGEKVLVLAYLGLLPGHFILLRELPLEMDLPYASGGRWLLLGSGITWLGDTAAYLVGSLLGRHSLGTPVSPRKSVEGVLGGLAGALLTAWLLARVWAPFLALWQALLLGAILSTGGQLGDLFESLLKRDAAVKDSGASIPGHGGWLDRVDSLLFTLPLMYYFLRWVAFR